MTHVSNVCSMTFFGEDMEELHHRLHQEFIEMREDECGNRVLMMGGFLQCPGTKRDER